MSELEAYEARCQVVNDRPVEHVVVDLTEPEDSVTVEVGHGTDNPEPRIALRRMLPIVVGGTCAVVAYLLLAQLTPGPKRLAQELTFAELFAELRTEDDGIERPVLSPQPTPRTESASETLPPPQGSTPAHPEADSASLTLRSPAITVRGLVPDQVHELRSVAGIAAASHVGVAALGIVHADQLATLYVALIDPEDFRPFTPATTAHDEALWDRVAAGDLILEHRAGEQLAAPLGTTMEVAGRTHELRLGGLATSGLPVGIHALLNANQRDVLDAPVLEEFSLVALESNADIEAVNRHLREELGALTQIALPGGTFLNEQDSQRFFEPLPDFTDQNDGTILMDDPAWMANNIVSRHLPIIGDQICHRQMHVQLTEALTEIQQRGLAELIDPDQTGPCWEPRRMDLDPNRPVSLHATGRAIRLNNVSNPDGQSPTMDPRVVRVFERWGFRWGGWWDPPQGAHFELAHVLRAP